MRLNQLQNNRTQDKLEQTSQKKSLCSNKVEEKVYKIGTAVFRSIIRQRQNLRLFNGLIIEVLQKDIWTIKGPDGDKQTKWPGVFRLMIQSSIKQLHFQKNPKILKEIYPIKFHQLKYLNVFAANIQNYEAFTFLDMPKLQKINLIYNNCRNFKALNKVHMPSVTIICIYMKQTAPFNGERYSRLQSAQVQDFQRWGFELNELRLQKGEHDQVMMEDLSRLAKSKKSLENVYYCRDLRIDQKKVMRTIKEKGAVKFHTVQGDNFQFQEYNVQA